MTPEPTHPTQDIHIRLAILEQSFVAFGQEQQTMRSRVDRINDYIFGSDDEDGMRSQVKSLVKQVELLTAMFQESQRETATLRKQNAERLDTLEDRQKVLEDWQKGQTDLAQDRKGLSRQYVFMLISTIVGSSVSILIGWLLGRVLTP